MKPKKVIGTIPRHRIEFDCALAKVVISPAPWTGAATAAALRDAMLAYNAALEVPHGVLAHLTYAHGAKPEARRGRIVRNNDNVVVAAVEVAATPLQSAIGQPGRWNLVDAKTKSKRSK